MPAYFRPRTLEEALSIAAQEDVTILAGGTDVYPAKAARAGWGDMRHSDVLDISAIQSLRGLRTSEEGCRFGALTTWTDLRRACLPPAFAGYQAAAGEVGGAQVQNRATLAGNICTASPAGDGIPCLMTLDAEVELASSRRTRRVPIESFFSGYRKTVRKPDEIVTGIIVPPAPAGALGGFRKLGARRYLVISIVMAAAILDVGEDRTVKSARVAVGACTPVAVRLRELEDALIGKNLDEAAAAVMPRHVAGLAPIDDIRATGAFRRAAALHVVRDVIAGLAVRQHRRAA